MLFFVVCGVRYQELFFFTWVRLSEDPRFVVIHLRHSFGCRVELGSTMGLSNTTTVEVDDLLFTHW